MEKKVIINLDEYLYMTDNNKKLADMLGNLGKHIEVKQEVCLGPFGHISKNTVIIEEYYLKEFLTELLNIDKSFGLKIVDENGENLLRR